jgi:hypothetical protein
MNTKITIIVYFFLAISITSCVIANKNSQAFKDAKIAPENFNNPQLTLLVEKETSGMYKNLYNRRKEDACKKYYTGKYELVATKDIDADPKYNKELYRFEVVVQNHESTVSHRDPRTGITSSSYHVVFDYALLDRMTDKRTSLMAGAASEKKAFEKAMQRLNSYLQNATAKR